MTPFRVERLNFRLDAVNRWAGQDERHSNWPVVYVLDSAKSARPLVYVGESVNAAGRMRQHLSSQAKSGLRTVRVVIDDTFNKSACLDLEAHLIRWFAGDGVFEVLNGNEGMNNAAYFDRELYRQTFSDVFDRLRAEGLFERSVPQIENSDLFKLSPFKALTPDQAIAITEILEGLFEDLSERDSEDARRSSSVVQGSPGTGKTIVAIFLMKLLADVRAHKETDEVDPDSVFSDFFTGEHAELLAGFRMGLVVPQQSLRRSISNVFRKTPGLRADMVLSPFDLGSRAPFDLLIVDETHRLNQRANQPAASLNKKYAEINRTLFGRDDTALTQLDWITARSAHQVLLLDTEQSVRPADLPQDALDRLVRRAQAAHRHYRLATQMRVKADTDYVGYVRRLLRGEVEAGNAPDVGEYDLRQFDDLGRMRDEIRARDAEHGLARLVAGFAWDWSTRKDRTAFDIELDGVRLRWNQTEVDWINSPGSLDEVGSIHTVQGYDLNYAGVIIGPDLRYDAHSGRFYVDRDSYRDRKGKENNPRLGRTYTDDDLLVFIRNIYAVLLTRGIRGTYVYACDPGVREYLRVQLAGSRSAPK